MVLLMDKGPEFISHVLQQFFRTRVGTSYIRRGHRGTTDTSSRSTIDYERNA